jgi:hypothetical protein
MAMEQFCRKLKDAQIDNNIKGEILARFADVGRTAEGSALWVIMILQRWVHTTAASLVCPFTGLMSL